MRWEGPMEIATIVRIVAPEERVWPLLNDFTTHVVYRLSEEERRPVPTMRAGSTSTVGLRGS
jgi:hypothetical protein